MCQWSPIKIPEQLLLTVLVPLSSVFCLLTLTICLVQTVSMIKKSVCVGWWYKSHRKTFSCSSPFSFLSRGKAADYISQPVLTDMNTSRRLINSKKLQNHSTVSSWRPQHTLAEVLLWWTKALIRDRLLFFQNVIQDLLIHFFSFW